MPIVLIIEDNKEIANVMATAVLRMGYGVVIAHNFQDGLTQFNAHSFDIVLLDVNLPDGNGLDLLAAIRNAPPQPDVIIITGAESSEDAEIAIERGAWDYLAKPLQVSDLMQILQRVIQYRTESAEAAPPLTIHREGIIGSSPKLKLCFELAARAAATTGNVLITGETGTGKELFARAIHGNSERSNQPFVIVDCAALPDTLVESILFGHEKGAFTQAIASREGLAKQADKGTLFLDEIGELPLSIQSAFLRLLQEQKFRPVGANKEVKTNFRLIAATNRNLKEMVSENKFRKDLFFRLQSTNIHLPPLKERAEDIEELALFYLTKFCDNYGVAVKTFSKDFLKGLKAYHWPGNVRELVNVLERSIPLSDEEKTLFPIHLPSNIRVFLAKSRFSTNLPNNEKKINPKTFELEWPNLKTLIEKTERDYFQKLARETNGSIEKICLRSGLSRANVYNRLKKYNIRRNT